MARNAFGLEAPSPDLDEKIAASLEDAPPEEAPAESVEEVSEGGEVSPEPSDAPPSEPLAEVAAEEAVEEAPEEPGEEVPGTPYTGRYSTSYQTLEAFEEAHRNALDMHQKSIERAKQAEALAQQQAEYLQMAADWIKEQQSRPAEPPKEPTPAEIAAEAERYGMDPETFQAVKQLADQMLQERLAPVQQQFEQQQMTQAEQQRAAAVSSEIMRFKNDHTDDLTPEIEQDMVTFFNEQNLDPSDGSWYEIAYEAVTNPQLYEVLAANPAWVETEQGLNFARRMAGMTEARAPASRAAELAQARKRAQVESGNPGAPTTMEQPKANPAEDPNSWEAVMKLAAGGEKDHFGLNR